MDLRYILFCHFQYQILQLTSFTIESGTDDPVDQK